tara:strand:- start:37 stop:549 length:513 start_codon:yes stop_codon:yes gene_type:complete
MDTLVKIAGLLGFIISVATFVLTRIERKKRIEIEIFDEIGGAFPNLDGWPKEVGSENLMKVRFTNLGSQTVIIKPKTLKIECKEKAYFLVNDDYIGMDDFDEVLTPMSSRTIGVFQSEILNKLDISSPKKYDEESFNKLYPLKISVKDHRGKTYTNKRYSYHEAVCEYVT